MKGKILLLLALAGGISIFVMAKKIRKNKTANTLDKSVAQANALTQEEISEQKKGNIISNATANTYANRLLNAMRGMGTDEETVLGVLESLNSKGDLKLVISAFGIQQYRTATFKTINGDLVTWLKDELSGNDLKRAKAVFDKFGVAF